MSEYLILADNVIYKNEKLSFIGAINSFKTVAMPSEFVFDMVIICGPKWSIGEHKLSIKVTTDNGKELNIGNVDINVPNEDFVHNAFLNGIVIQMDYSVSVLTFHVFDNDKEIITNKYPVRSMLIPKGKKKAKHVHSGRFGTLKEPNIQAFYKLKTKQDVEEALDFLKQLPNKFPMKSVLKKRIEAQLQKIIENEEKEN